MGPYIVKRVLAKGAYELMDYDGIPLEQPRNGLYLKRYYAWFRIVILVLLLHFCFRQEHLIWLSNPLFAFVVDVEPTGIIRQICRRGKS